MKLSSVRPGSRFRLRESLGRLDAGDCGQLHGIGQTPNGPKAFVQMDTGLRAALPAGVEVDVLSSNPAGGKPATD